jgi:hypothetical protein
MSVCFLQAIWAEREPSRQTQIDFQNSGRFERVEALITQKFDHHIDMCAGVGGNVTRTMSHVQTAPTIRCHFVETVAAEGAWFGFWAWFGPRQRC